VVRSLWPPHLVRPCPSPGIYSRSNTSPDRIIFKSEFSNITLIISYIHFIYWIISKNGNSPLAGKNRAYGRISGFTAPVEINKKQHPRERELQNRWGHPGRLDLISVYSRPLAPHSRTRKIPGRVKILVHCGRLLTVREPQVAPMHNAHHRWMFAEAGVVDSRRPQKDHH
jgi:hypothetical protein